MKQPTLFNTGDKPKRVPRAGPPPDPKAKPAPRVGLGACPGPLRWGVAATIMDALDGLPADRKAAVVEKALFTLRDWELDVVARLIRDLLTADQTWHGVPNESRTTSPSGG